MDGKRRIWTISEITRDIKIVLENNFPAVWIEGEISNLHLHSSGHIYFDLKDEKSKLNCALFRNAVGKIKFSLEDGLQVISFGRISVYERNGTYSLYVEKIEPKGVGALQLAFEQLKEKLKKQGLFDVSTKKRIPFLPRRIGIVTSPTGAAIHDILNVLNRRFPNLTILINPVRVQGEGAAYEVARAIDEFNRLANVDVVIVARGGGSLEDLWAFNEEIVARSIYRSKIPIISAVGHETDYTIADFVSDVRSPTPSAAAELVVPRRDELTQRIGDHLERLKNALFNKVALLADQLRRLSQSYAFKQPLGLIRQYQQSLDDLAKGLNLRIDYLLKMQQEALRAHTEKLEALNPRKILSRGYSISLKLPKKTIIKDVQKLTSGDKVETLVHKGSFVSRVER